MLEERKRKSLAQPRRVAEYARLFLTGCAMGAADLVPGVSGGTMAVVLGIYERLLAAVGSGAAALGWLVRGDLRAARRRLGAVDWMLVAPLVCGIAAAVVLLASLIETQLVERPAEMAGLFCGLVAASTVSAGRLFEWRHPGRLALTAAVAVLTFAGLGARAAPAADPSPAAFFGAGAVAVCAMILPGVSGSFVLLMLGMYAAVIHVIDERLLGDAAVFAAGAGLGLALFSTLLGRLMERARASVMAVLVGLMAGSLRVLWPWPDGVGVTSRLHGETTSGTGLAWPAADNWAAPTAAALVGFGLVLLLTRLSLRSAR